MKIPYWTMCKIGPFIEMDLLWLSFETFAIWAYDIILWAVLMFFKLWTQTISLEDYIISNRTYFLRCISDIFLGHPIFEFAYIWPPSLSSKVMILVVFEQLLYIYFINLSWRFVFESYNVMFILLLFCCSFVYANLDIWKKQKKSKMNNPLDKLFVLICILIVISCEIEDGISYIVGAGKRDCFYRVLRIGDMMDFDMQVLGVYSPGNCLFKVINQKKR